MSPTLRALLGMPSLGLRGRTGLGQLDKRVRWVANSELEDPTPFLEGGELLLTIGMRVRADPAATRAYVDRLVDKGVVGLGFGVGLGHDMVPESLVRAAGDRGLVLLEVPRPTPFIAIGKAVSNLLAAEQYEDVTRAFAAQRELTRAALRPERGSGVVTSLARELDGWALLLDARGETVHAAPAAARSRVAEFEGEVRRLRSTGAPASSVLSSRDEHVVVQPLGVGRMLRGFLAFGRTEPLSTAGRTVLGAAVSLLSLELETPRAQAESERLLNVAVLRLLLAGDVEGAAEVAVRLYGGLPAEPVRIVVASGQPSVRADILESLHEDSGVRGARCLAAELDERLVVVAPDRSTIVEQVLDACVHRGCRAGVAEPVALAETPHGVEEGRRLVAAGERLGYSATRPGDLVDSGVASLLDSEAGRGFAAALVEPLLRHDARSRPDLAGSLRAYLRHNGHWEGAAAELGIHRHTLRYRMRRVSELLDRDVDSMDTRAELWLALKLAP